MLSSSDARGGEMLSKENPIIFFSLADHGSLLPDGLSKHYFKVMDSRFEGMTLRASCLSFRRKQESM